MPSLYRTVIKAIAPAALALGLAGNAQAAVVNVDLEVNLNDLSVSATQILWNQPGANPYFNFNAGDTVVMNYTFANNQALNLTNGSGIADTNLNFFVG